jgi:hypothetical protein
MLPLVLHLRPLLLREFGIYAIAMVLLHRRAKNAIAGASCGDSQMKEHMQFVS